MKACLVVGAAMLLLLAGCGEPRVGRVFVYRAGNQAGEVAPGELVALVDVLNRRLDGAGVARIEGENTVVVSLFGTPTPGEVRGIRQKLEAPGTLEFRIVANRTDDARLIQLAETLNPEETKVADPIDGRVIGRWTPIHPESETWNMFHGTGEWSTRVVDPKTSATSDSLSPSHIEILLRIEAFDVHGAHLTAVDTSGRPSLRFTLNEHGARRMEAMTRLNAPRPEAGEYHDQNYRYLAVVIDGKFFSAPPLYEVISDSGEISGNLTPESRDALVDVLRSGALPCPIEFIEQRPPNHSAAD